MAWTIANEFRKAALDGGLAILSGGSVRFDTSGDAELASLPIASIGAATTASPAVAVLSLTADTSVTDGTIAKVLFRTSGSATRLNGSVGVGSGDLQVSDNVIPVGATQVACSGGLSVSLQIS